MSELTDHYRMLLGLDASWRVDHVGFSFQDKKVEIRLSHLGGALICPDCGASCRQADLAPEREWRHLDTMQFQTIIRARAPRANCVQCGVKTTAVPWAGKHSRFTLLFEALAIEVLSACANVKRAAELLRIDWQTAHGIMQRAVERASETLARWPDIRSIGMIYRRREEGEKTQEETMFVISSHAPKVKMLAQYIRGHWGIENRQHWVLDVTFAEDSSRIRKGSTPEISAALRRMALNILQRDTTIKENIRGKRLRAGWDEKVLNAIYAGFSAN